MLTVSYENYSYSREFYKNPSKKTGKDFFIFLFIFLFFTRFYVAKLLAYLMNVITLIKLIFNSLW